MMVELSRCDAIAAAMHVRRRAARFRENGLEHAAYLAERLDAAIMRKVAAADAKKARERRRKAKLADCERTRAGVRGEGR